MSDKPKIGNTEWGLVIGALFMMDLVQWGLILLFGVGLLINEFIDLFIGMSFTFYLWIRGQMGKKQIISQIVVYLGEAGTDGGLPLWGLDGLYMFSLSKAEGILEKVPGGKVITSVVEKK